MEINLRVNYYTGLKPQPREGRIVLFDDMIAIEFIEGTQRDLENWDIKYVTRDSKPEDPRVIYRYGTKHPYEYIELLHQSGANYFAHFYRDEPFIKGRNNLFGKLKNSYIIAGIMLFIALLALAFFFLLPVINKSMASLVPMEWEQKLGEASVQQFISNEKLDKEKSVVLNQFFEKLNFKSDYSFKMYYINEDIVNAFALPGGHIVVYNGIVQKMNNYEELAGLLGHEFTHVEHRHSLKSMFQAMSSYVILSAIFGDLSGLSAIVLDNINSLRNLSYSRKYETDADNNALELLQERKINPKGITDLFVILQKESSSATMEIPQFLSSHPLTEKRIATINKKLENQSIEYYYHDELCNLFEGLK